MKSYNFIVGPCDTDSISFTKADMSPFTQEEQDYLLAEINELSPEFMEWEDDGYYLTCITLRAKNYILWDGKKKTVKGSAFKTSSKEIAMKELMQDMVDTIIAGKENTLVDVYHKYVKEALNVQDIHRWSAKKSLSKAVLECEGYKEQDILDKKVRRNETVIWDAVKNEADLQEGNKVYLYPVISGNKVEGNRIGKTGKPLKDKVTEITGLKLEKNWVGDHNIKKLLERCYATVSIFKLALDMDQFIDYSKPKHADLLEALK